MELTGQGYLVEERCIGALEAHMEDGMGKVSLSFLFPRTLHSSHSDISLLYGAASLPPYVPQENASEEVGSSVQVLQVSCSQNQK